LDAVFRALLARHLAGDVEEHDVPQVVRLLVRRLERGVHGRGNVLNQPVRRLVEEHFSTRPLVVTAVVAGNDDVRGVVGGVRPLALPARTTSTRTGVLNHETRYSAVSLAMIGGA